MRRLRMVEAINFRDFMDGSYRNTDKSKMDIKLLSVVPASAIFSPSTILNPPHVIAEAYGIIFVIGGVLVGAAILERLLVMGSQQRTAEVITGFVQMMLPWALVGGLILFVLTNPLM
ncbi:hypothetical protein GN156_03890 [bacterium LRH843]|nr:hypothetical protein [bacterium LRH843]